VYGLFRWTSKKSRLYAFEVTEKKTESAAPAGDGGDLYRKQGRRVIVKYTIPSRYSASR
jgi:hypothetical protein